jgi:hypothetical protein
LLSFPFLPSATTTTHNTRQQAEFDALEEARRQKNEDWATIMTERGAQVVQKLYVTLRSVTFHCTTLHYKTLHYITVTCAQVVQKLYRQWHARRELGRLAWKVKHHQQQEASVRRASRVPVKPQAPEWAPEWGVVGVLPSPPSFLLPRPSGGRHHHVLGGRPAWHCE